jgi:hypothetical protein
MFAHNLLVSAVFIFVYLPPERIRLVPALRAPGVSSLERRSRLAVFRHEDDNAETTNS